MFDVKIQLLLYTSKLADLARKLAVFSPISVSVVPMIERPAQFLHTE